MGQTQTSTRRVSVGQFLVIVAGAIGNSSPKLAIPAEPPYCSPRRMAMARRREQDRAPGRRISWDRWKPYPARRGPSAPDFYVGIPANATSHSIVERAAPEAEVPSPRPVPRVSRYLGGICGRGAIRTSSIFCATGPLVTIARSRTMKSVCPGPGAQWGSSCRGLGENRRRHSGQSLQISFPLSHQRFAVGDGLRAQ